jgi:CRISPR/Cas system CSM-associated protein Csm3 (group 7 of RAMP superfamily)
VVISFGLELRAVTLLTVGGGIPELLGADVVFARMPEASGRYKLYIPGSSVKGALRSAASRIAKQYGFESCGEVEPGRITRAHSRRICDVCTLFGYPNRPGGERSPLVVSNFEPVENLDDKLVTITHISIDEKRATAREWALYVVEYVIPGVSFRGHIHVDASVKNLLPLLLLAIAELRTGRFGRRSVVDARIVNDVELEKYLSHEWDGLLKSLREWLWVRLA